MPDKTNAYLFVRRFVRRAKEVLGLALLVLQILQLLLDLIG